MSKCIYIYIHIHVHPCIHVSMYPSIYLYIYLYPTKPQSSRVDTQEIWGLMSQPRDHHLHPSARVDAFVFKAGRSKVNALRSKIWWFPKPRKWIAFSGKWQ